MGYKSKFNETHNTLVGEINISGSLTAGAWEEGYLGNGEFIEICPADFCLSSLLVSPNAQGGTGRTHIELIWTNDNGGTVRIPALGTRYAQKIIPKGFTATSGIVNATADASACRFTSSTVDSDDTDTHTPGTAPNTLVAFSPTVVGDGITYVTVSYAPVSATTSLLAGAQIFIEKT